MTGLACGRKGDGVASEMGQLFATDAASFLADPKLAEEVFGASSLIVRCSDLDALKQVLRRLEDS